LSPALEIDLTNTLTTSRRTDALRVPLHFSVVAKVATAINDSAALVVGWIGCPDYTDFAPTATAAPLANMRVLVVGFNSLAQLDVRTSSAGLIASRANTATVDSYLVSTIGFKWDRRV